MAPSLSYFGQYAPPPGTATAPRRAHEFFPQSGTSSLDPPPAPSSRLEGPPLYTIPVKPRAHSTASPFEFSPRVAESGRSDSSVSPPTSNESEAFTPTSVFTPNSPHPDERRMSQPHLSMEYSGKDYQPTAQQNSLMNRALEGNRPFNFHPSYQHLPPPRPTEYDPSYLTMPHHSSQLLYAEQRPSFTNFEPRYNFQYPTPASQTSELYSPNAGPSRHTLPLAVIPLLHSQGQQQHLIIQSAEIEPAESPKKRKLSASAPSKPRRISTQTFPCPHPDCGAIFSRNYNMQSHLKAHQGIRDFDCLYCVKKFSRRHDRSRHIASVHNIPIASQGISTEAAPPPVDDSPRHPRDPLQPPSLL